jgi:hypothetical protein
MTSPFGSIMRIVELPVSTTYTLPHLSTSMSCGLQKRATSPRPLVLPHTPGEPATVLTLPLTSMRRTVWLPVSAIHRLPHWSSATPFGLQNWAAGGAPVRAAAGAVAGQRGDQARGRDLAHHRVAGVGQVDIALGIGTSRLGPLKRAALPAPSA